MAADNRDGRAAWGEGAAGDRRGRWGDVLAQEAPRLRAYVRAVLGRTGLIPGVAAEDLVWGAVERFFEDCGGCPPADEEAAWSGLAHALREGISEARRAARRRRGREKEAARRAGRPAALAEGAVLVLLDEMSEDWPARQQDALHRACAAPEERAAGDACSRESRRQEKCRLVARVRGEIRDGPRVTPGPHP
jgi:hypothetical protein